MTMITKADYARAAKFVEAPRDTKARKQEYLLLAIEFAKHREAATKAATRNVKLDTLCHRRPNGTLVKLNRVSNKEFWQAANPLVQGIPTIYTVWPEEAK